MFVFEYRKLEVEKSTQRSSLSFDVRELHFPFKLFSRYSLDEQSFLNMSCQHAGCSLEIFTTCPNHCTQNLCLAHVIEHGDIFVRDFTKTLDHLDKTTCTLIEEANIAATEVNKLWTLHHCFFLTDMFLVDQTSSA